MKTIWNWGLAALMGVSLLAAPVWAEEEPATPAAEENAAGAEEAQPAGEEEESEPEEPKDIYAIPEDATVEQLLAVIEGIEAYRPRSAREYYAHRAKALPALEAAAKNILELNAEEGSEARVKAEAVLLQSRMSGLRTAAPEEQAALLEDVRKLIAASKSPGAQEVQLAMGVARGIESSGNSELAGKAYLSLSELFANAEDERVARFSKTLAGSGRRLGLQGNEIELAGKTVEGEEFTIGSLKGKVVLVDFWATWCGPCRAEYPNIKKNYDKYAEHGFEVVGVSLDSDREALDKYLKDKEVPWITLHDEEAGGSHPSAEYYGVTGIPTMLLVDRDGKVVSLRARGGELTDLLAKLFPDVKEEEPADEKSEEADDAENE